MVRKWKCPISFLPRKGERTGRVLPESTGRVVIHGVGSVGNGKSIARRRRDRDDRMSSASNPFEFYALTSSTPPFSSFFLRTLTTFLNCDEITFNGRRRGAAYRIVVGSARWCRAH